MYVETPYSELATDDVVIIVFTLGGSTYAIETDETTTTRAERKSHRNNR